jgi:4-amino-4-deoxy-L-arabinose transferase-like glycosyltransferase
MRTHLALLVLIAVYLIIGSLYALNTPEWQAPDEPAHYNYIRQLAGGSFPIIEPGDYDQEYQSRVISSRFDPQYSVLSFEYEDYQPPLYYLTATLVYSLFEGDLKPMRIVSVVFGAGVVILAYFIALRLFPGRTWLALTAAAFVAFLPQHVAMLSSVNNDSLAELLIAGILFLLVTISLSQSGQGRWVRPARNDEAGVEDSQVGALAAEKIFEGRYLLLTGVLLGLGFVTKVTVYIMVPVVSITLLWIYWDNWRALIKASLIVFVPAFLIGLVWWIRNTIVYGGIDILGTQAHNAIVVGQPRTAEWIAERGLGDTLRAFFQTTFQSFWGQFGWMGVVMPRWVYGLLLLFTLLTAGGLILALIRKEDWRQLAESSQTADSEPNYYPVLAILAGTFAFSLSLFLGYNLTFVQHQGRYLFSALIPISIAVALAWSVLIWPITRRWSSAAYLLPFGLAIALVGLDLLALYRFIIPALS